MGVILTKDNILKRHWLGYGGCVCDKDEAIQHFFYCHVERFVWRVFTMVSGIASPKKLNDLSGVWFHHQQVGRQLHARICVGASAILSSI